MTTINTLAAAVLVTTITTSAKSEVLIEYADGSILSVPETYEIDVYPKGFSPDPFDFNTNIIGKYEGRWPLLDAICSKPQFSPSPPLCEDEPYYIVEPKVVYECDGFSPTPPGCF